MAVLHPVSRTERGWAGHFICCDRCRFRRNTLLECGNLRIVVSTVGAFFPTPDSEADTIGHERHYETLAFHAVRENGYWEADVGSPVDFDSPYSIFGIDEDSDRRANDQHEAVVLEIGSKMAEVKINMPVTMGK